jgi:hypothetical protein
MADDLCLDLLSGYGEENHDSDSLFGGDDGTELTSLFTEVCPIGPFQELDCEPALLPPQQARPQQATNSAAQPDLPESRSQAQPDHQLALPMPQLHLPAVPDPRGASLSRHDGHTSGDLVVSTQDFIHDTPGLGHAIASSEEFPDAAALEAELERLWDSITAVEQPVNAQTGSQNSDAAQAPHDDNLILPTQIPGFRYGSSYTNMTMRLPRRIDQDQKDAEELMYFITLSKHARLVPYYLYRLLTNADRNAKIETLYDHLELDYGNGKLLAAQMRKLLKEPPLIQLVEQPATTVIETKKTLIRIALYMLITKEWGSTWFGEGCQTAETRTLLWPRDSSM